MCQLSVEHMFAKTLSQVNEMRTRFVWCTCLQKCCHKCMGYNCSWEAVTSQQVTILEHSNMQGPNQQDNEQQLYQNLPQSNLGLVNTLA